MGNIILALLSRLKPGDQFFKMLRGDGRTEATRMNSERVAVQPGVPFRVQQVFFSDRRCSFEKPEKSCAPLLMDG